MRLLSFCTLSLLCLSSASIAEAQMIAGGPANSFDPLAAWRLSFGRPATTLPFSLSHATKVDPKTPIAASAKLGSDTSIDVVAGAPRPDAQEGFAIRVTARQMETAAGTFGDPSRFLQTLAGVAAGNDQRNDFLVRGGNPSENGFLIDNIEIPSINQLALSDSTGGFVSMLDAAAIQHLTLHTDAYDSRYDQRLSSIIDISTRPEGKVEPRSILELGLGGLGGSSTRPLGRDGSLFVSARQSVLQYVTSDIGLNGVPVYRNAFLRADGRIDERDNWWGVSLTGIDSIKIRPAAGDNAETSTFDVNYNGWRNTTGLNWQHVFSAHSFAVASLGQSEQSQSILEDDQLQSEATVYDEHSVDAITTAKYDWTFEPNPFLVLTAGARESLDQIDYSVAQPIGLQNPYSLDPTPLDATAMRHRFATASSAAYVQAAFNLPYHARLILGERAEQWALGGNAGTTSKALLSMPVFGRLLHFGYAEYEQMPATLYLLSFDNLRTLKPIRSRQYTGGATLADNRRAHLTLQLYQKNYSDYPVAQNYPQLSLANIADTFGQAFLMFPMVGQGTGLARGAELAAATHLGSRLDVTGTLTYARSWYAGLDGVLRRGNYDIPLTANVNGVWRLNHGLTFSWRYTTSSGRPYTPDDMAASLEQDREVYDLTAINAARSQAYNRLDFRFEQTRKFRAGFLTWHVGLENAMNNQNFYMRVWEPRIGASTEQDQMPLFPDGGIKYSF